MNAAGNMTLVSLQNGEEIKFYIFNAEDQTFIDFIPVEIKPGKFIYIKSLDEANEEFSSCEVIKLRVDEQEVDAWKLDDTFSIVCAWDMQGKEVLYRYENTDEIFQRYAEIVVQPEEPEEVLSPIEAFLAEYYLYVIIGLGAVVLILLITVICLAVTRKTKRGKGKARERRKARQEALREEVKKEIERTE